MSYSITNATYSCHNRDPVPAKFNHVTNIETCTLCCDHSTLWKALDANMVDNVYVPTCIHLFPHARTDTMQVVEHEPNFSKFYPLTISFLVSQFCTLESSLCVSSSDYYLLSLFASSLIKVVLDPKIRTTECTHQTTSVHRMNS